MFDEKSAIRKKTDNTRIGVLKRVEAELNEAGFESSGCEAEILLCHFLELRKVDLFFDPDVCIDDGILDRINKAVAERIKNIPLQYIVGSAYFYGLELGVEPGVFIPRPETEVLVERLIELACKEFSNSLKILELCTGSGNIPVALTKNIHYCKIISSDISSDALRVARQNAVRNGLAGRIEFVQGDLFEAVREELKGNGFDWIIANPPYIDINSMLELPLDVYFEPSQALLGGADGLDFYRRIIADAGTYLRPKGYIAFEFGDDQRARIEQIISFSRMFDKIEFFTDLNGIYRFVIARRANG